MTDTGAACIEEPESGPIGFFDQLKGIYTTVTDSRHWYRLLALVAAGLYCFDVGSDIATGVTYLQLQGDNNSSDNATGSFYLQDQSFNNGSNISSGNNYLQGEGDGKRDIWWGVLTLIFAAVGLVATNFWAIIFYPDCFCCCAEIEHDRWGVVRKMFLFFQLGALLV